MAGLDPAIHPCIHGATRSVAAEAQYGIFFGAYRIANIDLTTEETVGHVSEQSSVMSSG
jgi:hypothetical protein